jgi:integrase
MAKSHLKLVAPTEVNRTGAPTRRPNAELRTREHLTPGEVEALVEAAKANRHGHRDATMILLAFRHGLRAAELCDLRWDQVEFNAAVLHVRRVKNGTPSAHPRRGDELRLCAGSSTRARRRRLSSSASGDPRSRPPALKTRFRSGGGRTMPPTARRRPGALLRKLSLKVE